LPNNNQIRPVVLKDIPALKRIVDATLFPAEMLDSMIAPYFADRKSSDIWFTCLRDGAPIAVAFCEAERMTAGTWNLLAIGVEPEHQGKGIGAEMMKHLEAELAGRGERLLIVETSGLPEYDRTRRFYRRLGYIEEARIREFYAAGEDKIVFWKSLLAAV
jgi:ribosomal protein S18 acetylase RimI-like enzyme